MNEARFSDLPDLTRARRVLIIRLSAIGDVIHALPLSAALKRAYPHLELTWLVEEMSADVVRGNPCLEEVLVIPRNRWKRGRWNSPQVWREYLAFLNVLRRRRFDVTLDLQGYGKSALYALATGARHRLGWHRMRDGAQWISRPLPKRPESLHRVDWFLDVARALGVETTPDQVTFPLAVAKEAQARVQALLQSASVSSGPGTEAGSATMRLRAGQYAVLNASANDAPRRWGADDLGEVARLLAQHWQLRSVLVGVPKEAGVNRRIVEYFETRGESDRNTINGVEPPLDLTGQTTVGELAALVADCALQISGDTGSLHLAAALGRPVIGLYGASDPAHAGPWGQPDHVLQRRDLCDSGCSLRRCVRAEAEMPATREDAGMAYAPCLRAITPEDVATLADTILMPAPLAPLPQQEPGEEGCLRRART